MSPVRLLTNVPVPLPSEEWLSARVGFELGLQHTPRTVTVAPPSEVTFPPLVAVVWAMLVTGSVVKVGRTFIIYHHRAIIAFFESFRVFLIKVE